MIRHLPFGVIGRIEAELSYFSGYLINWYMTIRVIFLRM
jgi:hypothetical protein